MKILLKKEILLIFVIITSCCLLINRLDKSYLYLDDCCFSQIAKEMVKNNNYMFYTIGSELFFDNKPPLFIWLLALSGKIFGFHNFSMRLPSAIFGILSVVTMFVFVSKFLGLSVGFLSSFILLFTQQFLYYSRSATMEILYSLLLFLAFVSFWYGYKYGYRIGFILLGIFVGLAVMTRNIVGFIPYFIIFIYVLIIKDFSIFKKVEFYIGILLSLLISLPWHMYMVLNFGEKFVDPYFGVVLRYFLKEKKIWYEYIRKILENYWPWLPFLIVGIFNKIKNFKAEKQTFGSLMLIYVIVFFFIYQLAKYKFPQHIVPLYYPFAIFSAQGLVKIDSQKKFIFSKIFVALGILYCVLCIIFPILPNTLDSQEYKNLIPIFNKLKTVKEETVYILESDTNRWSYFNGIMFYTDKKVKVVPSKDRINEGWLLVTENGKPRLFKIYEQSN